MLSGPCLPGGRPAILTRRAIVRSGHASRRSDAVDYRNFPADMRAQYTVPEVRCQKVAPFGSGDLMRAWHVADHRFGVRSGAVTGILRRRKRQVEFIELLEEIDRTTPALITLIHLLCDNLSVHHGKQVQAWLSQHPWFRMHFTPVHCSWMNQVEHWFSILQRKRLVAPNVQDLADLEAKVIRFIAEWNAAARPFDWTHKSFEKVLAKVDAAPAGQQRSPAARASHDRHVADVSVDLDVDVDVDLDGDVYVEVGDPALTPIIGSSCSASRPRPPVARCLGRSALARRAA